MLQFGRKTSTTAVNKESGSLEEGAKCTVCSKGNGVLVKCCAGSVQVINGSVVPVLMTGTNVRPCRAYFHPTCARAREGGMWAEERGGGKTLFFCKYHSDSLRDSVGELEKVGLSVNGVRASVNIRGFVMSGFDDGEDRGGSVVKERKVVQSSFTAKSTPEGRMSVGDDIDDAFDLVMGSPVKGAMGQNLPLPTKHVDKSRLMRTAEGEYRRPRGRIPKGYNWDCVNAAWVCASVLPVEKRMQGEKKEKRAGQFGKPAGRAPRDAKEWDYDNGYWLDENGVRLSIVKLKKEANANEAIIAEGGFRKPGGRRPDGAVEWDSVRGCWLGTNGEVVKAKLIMEGKKKTLKEGQHSKPCGAKPRGAVTWDFDLGVWRTESGEVLQKKVLANKGYLGIDKRTRDKRMTYKGWRRCGLCVGCRVKEKCGICGGCEEGDGGKCRETMCVKPLVRDKFGGDDGDEGGAGGGEADDDESLESLGGDSVSDLEEGVEMGSLGDEDDEEGGGSRRLRIARWRRRRLPREIQWRWQVGES